MVHHRHWAHATNNSCHAHAHRHNVSHSFSPFLTCSGSLPSIVSLFPRSCGSLPSIVSLFPRSCHSRSYSMQPRKKDSRISDSSQASVVKASKPQSALSRHGRAGGSGSADSRGDGGGGGSQGSSLQSGREKSGKTGLSFRSAFSVVLVFVTALSIAVFAGRRIASRHEARIRKDAAFPVADLPVAGSRSGSIEGNGQLSANRGDGAISVNGRRSNGEASGGVAGGDGDASAAAAEGRGIESGAAREDASNEDAAEAGAKDDEAPLDVDNYLLEEARKLMEGMEQQQQQQESEEETDAEQRAERARLMDGGAAAGERGATGAADRLGGAVSGERESAAAGVSGNHSSGNHVVSASGDDEDPAKVQLGQEQREQEGEGDDGEQQEQQQEHAGVSPVRVGEAGTGSTVHSCMWSKGNGLEREAAAVLLSPLPHLPSHSPLPRPFSTLYHPSHTSLNPLPPPVSASTTRRLPLWAIQWACSSSSPSSASSPPSHAPPLSHPTPILPLPRPFPTHSPILIAPSLRNKKVAFVGDSVGLQQFFSFLCLISPTPRTHEPYIESRDADYKFNWTTGWRGWQVGCEAS
ncbi:unnamed protein product [Closterium sp. NIES-54]